MTAQPIPFNGLEDKQADRNRNNLPGGATLATLIRDGATIADICADYHASKTSVYTRLRDAGYTPEGTPRTQTLPARIAVADFLESNEDWMADRSCNDEDPELWHSTHRGETRKAKWICRGCPVQTACLTYALRIEEATPNNYRWGVWGGLDPDERKKLAAGK